MLPHNLSMKMQVRTTSTITGVDIHSNSHIEIPANTEGEIWLIEYKDLLETIILVTWPALRGNPANGNRRQYPSTRHPHTDKLVFATPELDIRPLQTAW
ncbi:MAG: hypothetical protein A3G52_04060 [Candidatus Taylorbacteria bacterium RIFCSPLOWO2_12_FULL_43_20]|uniref:Uncharacterized protein n=1 Tax=Candidatus Taylorbacteria bacterium RIFCSPLOWO2_12_FULL_43_20 TaxID=1802332 RepID=A0A1G2P0U9_9BACT|nr:MAG: hypothetical protein A2825_00260 [Candidatus Taylorbacteria bacterium RIFCSPHIGHO2_01_FULL_43_120]OHA22563.1 MAG: hypothetical protein A3B98_02620 [Candidatus Taylorbacteria bacterium RIFCSPHIGHO2_02_FULL_43_55]OHA28597.1 MAG: hypothetical protein A3E92_01495 [Candidatus Taylorbacteria bacterium RIFCSPHIGHO2_12_FULL_42_34]OHA30511.1 MAG: hypothetical protein A3B09_00135 [Candidatus Taylorbacteria bacterium RIFCSPLOWO2_01_FULL_43_83]OHA38097.1 MAG: hypothetical protein A3H58_00950 [Candi